MKIDIPIYNGKNNDIWLKNSVTLRRLIGVMVMLLPLILWFFLWVYSGHSKELDSISHYYFTRVDSIFIMVISLMAFFLIVYKGDQIIDFILSLISGLSALVLLLFPTSPIIEKCEDFNVAFTNTFIIDSPLRENIHFAAAAIFIITLAVMSIFIFPRPDKFSSDGAVNVQSRNMLYRICGIGMLLAIAVIGLYAIGLIDKDFYNNQSLTFWMEVVALEFFGVSWLIKGETILKG